MTNIPDFVPATPGDQAVIDLSGTLSPGAIRSITNSADSLGYKAKVLVLPKDYVCPDVHKLSLDLAQSWHTNAGRTLLTVVDLKGHKVRMIGSPDLNASGITTDFLRDMIISRDFVPYMKAGDLSSAIRVSLVEVNKRISDDRNAATVNNLPTATVVSASSRLQNYSYQQESLPPARLASEKAGNDTNWGAIFAVLIALAMLGAITWLIIQRRLNSAAVDKLRERINQLYGKADQLAQASDYVDSNNHPKLVHSISDFFAQLQTLEKAYEQTKQLFNTNHTVLDTKKAVAKCGRYIDVLTKNADSLIAETNKLTGVVTTYEPNASIELQSDISDEDKSSKRPAMAHDLSGKGNTITLPSGRSFQTPSWVVLNNYSRTSDDGLAAMSLYLDKQQRRDELAAIAATDYRINDFPATRSYSSGFSSSHSHNSQTSSSSSDAGSSWSSHDSSSSSFSDSGGSWDSGSSSDSSSSSDAGGSW